MIFKRTLHPVGQGAFFSEEFIEDSLDEVKFTVVYDCGEGNHKTCGKNLQREINNTFLLKKNAPKTIDVLFLSHFDNDHINGLNTLIDNEIITSKTKVIIPFAYPLLLKELLATDSLTDILSTVTITALKSLFGLETTIIGVDNSEVNDFSRENNIESLPDVLKNGISISTNDYWNYSVYNTTNDSDISAKFNNALSERNIEIKNLNDIEYIKSHITELKQIYKNIGKGNNGVSAINVNSLQVFSYPNRENNLLYIRHLNSCSRCYYMFLHHIYGIKDKSFFSCLYTGDTIMNDDFFNKLRFLPKPIEMIQIPHHGREKNYCKRILNENITCGFTNFSTKYKANVFVKQITKDFCLRQKPFFEITEDFHSCFELYVKL